MPSGWPLSTLARLPRKHGMRSLLVLSSAAAAFFFARAALAQCIPVPHLCPGGWMPQSKPYYCSQGSWDRGSGCLYFHPLCSDVCAQDPGHIQGFISRPEISPGTCDGSPPLSDDRVIEGTTVSVVPFDSKTSCVTIPAGVTKVNLHCKATEDATPKVGYCKVDPNNGESCGLGWSWAFPPVGRKYSDGSHKFCVTLYNQSHNRNRFLTLRAAVNSRATPWRPDISRICDSPLAPDSCWGLPRLKLTR